jgi:hypothetical protein
VANVTQRVFGKEISQDRRGEGTLCSIFQAHCDPQELEMTTKRISK